MSTLRNPGHGGTAVARPSYTGGAAVFLDGVIDRIIQLHEERGAARFAFAAPHWRAGTTHVVNLVAEELVERHRYSVAVMPTASLRENYPSQVSQNFDFTLIDCPALLKDPQGLRWTNAADAVFLVVAAGYTHRNEVEEAQRLLKACASRLEGVILNRRSYPIPKILYNLL